MTASGNQSSINDVLTTQLNRYQRLSLLAGGFGLLLGLGGAFLNADQFFQSYLFAYLFWVQLAVGCLILLMIQHVAGGGWGAVIRRLLEAGMMTLPLMLLLFIPILFGMGNLYPWARPDEVAHSELLQHKTPYLNIPFFIIRTVIYFAIWSVLAYFLNRWSQQQDQDPTVAPLPRFQQLSGPGLAFSFLAITFASFDWMMSLEPEWFSTIYGFMFAVGSGTAAFAGAILLLAWLSKYEPLSTRVEPKHFNDLGNFLLASVMLWAYMSLSQYLIIWSGNLPEEITWYIYRTSGGWQWLSIFLVIFHFMLPFFILMSRGVKRKARALAMVAALIIFMRLIDLFWLVIPAFYRTGFHLDWLNIILPIAMGGLWLAVFIWQLKRKPLIALNDPHLEEVADHGRQQAASHTH